MLAFVLPLLTTALAAGPTGYYRMPTVAGDTVVFVSEGDLWRVSVDGGVATRLTSHPGQELAPALSPDGSTVAFVGSYEGPAAVYTMPSSGGLPTRWTWDGGRMAIAGWASPTRLLYATDAESTLPSGQLVELDVGTGAREVLPLAEASDGAWDDAHQALYFTRMVAQPSNTRRYQGGSAQQLWRYAPGAPEATPLTTDFPGTSKRAMWWQGRVYFASDRSGAMQLWSMAKDGTDLRQLTTHADFEVRDPSLGGGRIVYQLGADLRVYDIATGADRALPITLASDLDQTRERWLRSPMDFLTSWHLSPDGERVVLTARGQVWVAPRKAGRLVDVTHEDGSRWRNARFAPDGASLVGLTDRSGEVELWQAPANGDGAPTQLTEDGKVLRWDSLPSPDGRWIATADKDQELWLYDRKKDTTARIAAATVDQIGGLAWSPDGRWLAYVMPGDNTVARIHLYDTTTGTTTPLTTDRYDSYDPAWSPDGAWLYFLSDRHLESVVPSPWGAMAPEPYFAKKTLVYALSLKADGRSPFAPADELHVPPPEGGDDAAGGSGGKPGAKGKDGAVKDAKGKGAKGGGAPAAAPVEIALDGLAARLWQVPVDAGIRSGLWVNDKGLYWLEGEVGDEPDARRLVGLAVGNDPPKPKTVVDGVRSAELSADGKRFLVRKGDALHVIDAAPGEAKLDETAVDLSAWMPSFSPAAEWRQMYTEAWRLERDYFWDRGMSGTDWKALHGKYLPLAERVRAREELSDVLAQLVAELGVLHMYVNRGDGRDGPDNIGTATLGAELARVADGWKVTRVYAGDPDDPARRSPLTRPGVDVPVGSVLLRLDGVVTTSVPDPAVLLRGRAGDQVLVHYRKPDGTEADTIVTPVGAGADADLRYLDWELERRRRVEAASGGRFAYVHLRAMGTNDFADFARGYYPAFDRDGLIIDVRRNRGGNIDSWILSRLSRKVWFYWTQRVGRAPSWNMQYAFRGHIVVLVDARTASDGEAFAEGVRRLGLGHVIGTRTWGGEIWLSSDNVLVDKGIATAAEYGVYGPEGVWLIEGRGVEPDEVVDNLPVATARGGDAQLDAAIRYLEAKVAAEPVTLPPEPKKPTHMRPR